MSKTSAEMLAEFHNALNQPYGHGGDLELRAKLQCEETDELGAALAELHLAVDPDEAEAHFAHVAQELADLVYVAYGTAHVLGIPLDRVLAEVHMANMSKFDEDGNPILRADGKLLKSDGYIPPDIEHALACTCRPDEEDPQCAAHGSGAKAHDWSEGQEQSEQVV